MPVAPASSVASPLVGDAVLACVGLLKTFGRKTVVDDVGFSIAPGETYGLLGPNGAGKTTTISMLCGLLRRDAGTVRACSIATWTPNRGLCRVRSASCRRT